MKKILLTLSAILLVFFCSCSDSNKTKLNVLCTATDKTLPQDMGIGLFESMKYDTDSNCVVMKFLIDESFIDIKQLSRAKAQQQDYMRSFLCQKDNEELLKALTASKASLKMIYEGQGSHEQAVINISASEIGSLRTAESSEDNNLQQLEKIIEAANVQCPTDEGDGLFLVSVTIDNNYVCYNFSYDPEQLSFENAESPETKSQIMETLSEQFSIGPFSHMHSLLKELGYGMKYIYSADDDSLPVRSVTLTPSEIKNL